MALDEALLRLGLLQRALRRRLLSRAGKTLALNRFDPQGRPVDFSELDAMADALWGKVDRADLRFAKSVDAVSGAWLLPETASPGLENPGPRPSAQ